MIGEYKDLRRIEMGFIEQLKIKAKSNKKTIVLPEGMDRRTYEAAQQIVEEDFADIIILASPEEAEKYGKGYDIENVTIIDPKDCVKTKEYAEEFYMLRKAKGMTETQAYAMLVSDYMYFAWLEREMQTALFQVPVTHLPIHLDHHCRLLRLSREASLFRLSL